MKTKHRFVLQALKWEPNIWPCALILYVTQALGTKLFPASGAPSDGNEQKWMSLQGLLFTGREGRVPRVEGVEEAVGLW